MPTAQVPRVTITVGDIAAWIVCDALLIWLLSSVFSVFMCGPNNNLMIDLNQNVTCSHLPIASSLKPPQNKRNQKTLYLAQEDDFNNQKLLHFIDQQLTGARRRIFVDLCQRGNVYNDNADYDNGHHYTPNKGCNLSLHDHLEKTQQKLVNTIRSKLLDRRQTTRVAVTIRAIKKLDHQPEPIVLFMVPFVGVSALSAVVMIGCIVKQLVEMYYEI